MSYILDALKKSEMERQQGRVPDLTTAPVVVGRAGAGDAMSRRRPYLIAAVALLAAAAAVISWRPWQQGAHTEPAAVSAAPVRAPSAEAVRVPPDSHVDLPVALPRAANTPATTAKAEGRHIDQSATAASTNPPNVTMRPARSATVDSNRPDSVAQPPKARQRTEPISSPVPAAAHQAPAASIPQATASTPPPAASPAAVPESMPPAQPLPAAAAKAGSGKSAGATAAKGMSNLADLPAAVRKNVARIDVAGFSYSDDPQARMAVVNDRILHEGDEVVPGVRLEKIGSDGIVFSHKGIRFRP